MVCCAADGCRKHGSQQMRRYGPGCSLIPGLRSWGPHLDFVDGRTDGVTRGGVGTAEGPAVRASANSPSASRIAVDIAAALRPVAWPSSAMPSAIVQNLRAETSGAWCVRQP